MRPGECVSPTGRKCRICWARELTYADELALKQQALLRFWNRLFPGVLLEPLVASARGRGYRTISKRRPLPGKQLRLGLVGDEPKPFPVRRCAIECDEHQALFERVSRSSHAAQLAGYLNYVILKGTYDQHWLLLNLTSLAGPVLSEARRLSTELGSAIVGCQALLGRPDDAYYLNSTRWQKIFGKPEIQATFAGKSFVFPPRTFCQVNHSLVDTLVETVASMLTGLPLVDLYCGFGLLGLSLNPPSLVGIDWDRGAVDAARQNARRFHQAQAGFVATPLEPDALLRVRFPREAFEVVLDPPRGGPVEGLIETLAERGPARAVHLFCDVERALPDLERWKAVGYVPVRAVPLDMFPGTSELELAVLLEPRRGRPALRRTLTIPAAGTAADLQRPSHPRKGASS